MSEVILARLCWLRCRKKRMAWQLWTPCRFLTSRSNRSRARKRKRRMVRARSISEWLSKRSNECGGKMKLSPIHVASLLLLGMLSPVCRPQDKPKPEDKPKSEVSTTPVKVTIVFTEYDGDKKTKSLPYTLYINAPDAQEPIIRNFRSELDLKLREGQTLETAMATDPISGKVMKVEVSLSAVK